MYRITCGENVIFDPNYVNEYPVSEVRLSERLNEGGALSFTLVKGHPQYNLLKPMESYITVMDEDELIFYGRVIESGLPSFSCQIQYTCEGAISFLNDSEVPPNSSQTATMTAEAFFRHCIAKHNEDINNDPRRTFTVGQVTATDRAKTDTFTISSYTQTKSAIQNNILNVYGGYLRIRVENSIRYIDWVQHYSDTVNPQQIVIGINVIERAFKRNWEEDIYTYLRPVGKNNMLLDNPLIRVFSQELVNKYGRIVKSVSFSDISNKAKLQQKAEEYIANLQTELLCEGDIELIDMQYIDGTSPKARLGDRYDNLDGLAGKEFTVTEIERDLTVPYKARLTFGNESKLSNTRSKALSQKSSRNKASAGQNFKYIKEVNDQVMINADTLILHGTTLDTHYELIRQTQNSYERVSANVDTLSGKVQTIEGTGVIQNDELLTHFAGTMQIQRNPDGTIKGLQFVDGTMVCDTVDGHTVTVGSVIASNTIKADGLKTRVDTIEGSALWTERNQITGVCGEYDLYTDPVTGKKTLIIKSGGGMKIRRNNVEYGVYDSGSLTGGIVVEKINDGSTVTKINGDKVNITATQLAQFGIVDPQTGTLTAGIITELINNQQGTVTTIRGDRIVIGDIGSVSGDTVDDWMQNAYNGSGVFAKFLTVRQLTAREITTMLAQIGEADISELDVGNLRANLVSAINGSVVGKNMEVFEHLYFGDEYEFMVLDATVSGNTLTITKTDGTTINFNKAVSLSGAWSGTTYSVSATAGVISGTAPSTSVYLTVEGFPNPNATVYAKVYKDNPNVVTNQLDAIELTLSEDTSNKKVHLKYDTLIRGTISTAATYNAGWTYGQSQRVRTTRDATSSELTIKTLEYDQRWTIVDTYTAPNGTTSEVKYIVASKSDRYDTGRNAVTLNEPTWGSTPSASPSSNSNSMTVTTNGRPTQLSKSRTFYLSAPDAWSSNKKTVYLSHTNTTTTTNRLAKLEIDASSVYTSGTTDGKNAVTLNAPTWGATPSANPSGNSNSMTVTTNGRPTQLSQSRTFYLSAPDAWSSNKKTVYLSHTDVTTTTNRLAKLEIDASSVYTSGTTDGKNAVTLNDPTWGTTPSASPSSNSNSMTVTTNGRPTQLSKSRTFYLSSPDAWSSNKKTVYLSHTDVTTAGNRLAKLEIDASSIYTNGVNSVTISSVARSGATVTATASNGQTGTLSLTSHTKAVGNLVFVRPPSGNVAKFEGFYKYNGNYVSMGTHYWFRDNSWTTYSGNLYTYYD